MTRVAYWDCFAGVSGDMALGALVDLGLPAAQLEEDLRGLKLPEAWELGVEQVHRGPIRATRVRVRVEGHEEAEGEPHVSHAYGARRLADVLAVLEGSALAPPVRARAAEVFRALAWAEGRVHGVEATQVHFHEVGAVDAILDVVGVVCGLSRLGIEEVYVSPLPWGRGTVRSAHGTLPVPAPATAALLEGLPVVPAPVEGETVTPTGAALVRTLARAYAFPPLRRVEGVGYGAGAAERAVPNVLRVVVGEMAQEAAGDEVVELETEIDDMVPELYGPLVDSLFRAGALDVVLTPVQMKKQRPGVLVRVLARPGEERSLAEVLLTESTTLGVRMSRKERIVARRAHVEVATPYGSVRVKVGFVGGRAVTRSPEYEDCRRLAATAGVPVRVVYEEALAAARSLQPAPDVSRET